MPWSLRSARDAVARFFATPEFGTGVVSDKHGTRARSSYPDEYSMSALARFPWVYAAIRAKAIDLSGVPIVAYKTTNGVRTAMPDHPLARLLNRPGHRRGGIGMRRQWYLDHGLTGDGFLWRQGAALFRLHPRRVEVLADSVLGIPTGYILRTIEGREKVLAMEDVVHVSDISWEDGPQGALGTGAIMPLHHDLVANLSVKEMTAKAAKRGRLELLMTPRDEGMAFTPKQVDQLVADFERNRAGGEAAFVVGQGVTATPLGLSPRDMEFGEQDLRTMAAALAVIGVPPVRVGIPSANYGTTKQQMRTYWEGLVGEAALFDEALSMLDDDPSVTLEHDFTNVEALQVSYTERLDRVRGWYELGATAGAAAAYEGFVGAPVGDKLFGADDTAHRPAEKEPEEGQERVVRVLAAYLAGAQRRYAERIAAPEWDPATDVESVRLLVDLERLGIPDDQALALSGEVTQTNAEVAYQYRANGRNLEGSPAFSAHRARTLSLRMVA